MPSGESTEAPCGNWPIVLLSVRGLSNERTDSIIISAGPQVRLDDYLSVDLLEGNSFVPYANDPHGSMGNYAHLRTHVGDVDRDTDQRQRK
jgi:hypothetical protein